MDVKAKFYGEKELLKKLGELRTHAEVEKISYKATFGTAKDIRELARANAKAKFGEGALERGFAIKKIKRSGTRRGYTVGVRHGRHAKKGSTDDPFYWWFQEFGTVHIEPKGFFRSAIAEIMGRGTDLVIRSATKAVNNAVDRTVKKYGNGKAKR